MCILGLINYSYKPEKVVKLELAKLEALGANVSNTNESIAYIEMRVFGKKFYPS